MTTKKAKQKSSPSNQKRLTIGDLNNLKGGRRAAGNPVGEEDNGYKMAGTNGEPDNITKM